MNNYRNVTLLGKIPLLTSQWMEFDNYKKPDGTGFKDGKEARKWAFDLGNPISEFLACTRQVALIIGSNLFVHGGILPQIAKKYSVKNLNELMSLYLLDKLDGKQSKDFIYSNISPLWTRKFGNIGIQKFSKNNKTIEVIKNAPIYLNH